MPWNEFFVLQELDAQIDHLREALELALRLSDPKSAHLEIEIVRARREAEKLQGQLTLRQEQRAEAVALIPPPFVARYERLRARVKTRPWVVSLHGSACPACNIVLPQLLWSSGVRRNLLVVWMLAMIVNVGMWLERFVIVITSLHRDSLPSSWDMYWPTKWDWATYAGTIGFFLACLFLFVRVLPMISIFEVRELVHQRLRSRAGAVHD